MPISPLANPLLTVADIECRYQREVALRNFNLSLNQGDLCCLVGPSGCGKTTALRAIAGLEPIHKGSISLGRRQLSSAHTVIAPEKRGIGMVFQEYALFPHLNVRDNISFGLQHMGRRAREREVDLLVELMSLTEISGEAYPHELSGGQQQRVALARALATRPQVLLMDEPFANLDTQLRRKINFNLKTFLKESNISAVLVTHDQEEGFAFADHMGVLRRGLLQQWDSPYNLYHQPANRFVAQFVGQGTFIPGKVNGADKIHTEIGDFPRTDHQNKPADTKGTVDVLVRPDDILFSAESKMTCEVLNKVFAGDRTLYTLKLKSGTEIQSLMQSHFDFPVGSRIGISTDLEHVIIFTHKE